MVIAVACTEDEVAERFRECGQFAVFGIDDGRITLKFRASSEAPDHLRMVEILREREVDLLLCNRIGVNAQRALANDGIKLFAGVTGKVDSVLLDWIYGKLEIRPDFTCAD